MKEKNMNKKIDVTAIHPVNGQVWTFRRTCESKLRILNDKLYYNRNKFQPSWKVLEVSQVPQNEIDAENAYFEHYGTACE